MTLKLLVVSLLVIGGCSSAPPELAPVTDVVTFVADPKLNSCSGDDYSYPVVVRIYYLDRKEAFETAEFQDLWGTDEVAAQPVGSEPPVSFTIAPGSATPAVSARPAGAAYLGILANFCRQDGGAWRAIIPLDAPVKATVHLQDVHLSVE
jgi:type VI secretion system VasD/TssJ family lipoprotein